MKIAVVGSYGVGMTMRVASVPGPGETVSGGSFSAGPGGKGSNQAIGMARLGADVAFVTAVGDDSLGREAMHLWLREHVACEHVLIGTRPTMVGFILVEESGENRIVIAPGALDELQPGDLEAFRPTIRNSDMLVVSMEIPIAVVVAALRIGRQENIRTLLNPAPATTLPSEVWDLVDVITPNESEAAVLLGLLANHGLSAEGLITKLRARTSAVIVLTLGSRGVAFSENEHCYSADPITASNVVDTTGAGDSFTAALAVALTERRSLRDAVRFASAAGSHAVTIPGVIDALPTRNDIHSLIGTTG